MRNSTKKSFCLRDSRVPNAPKITENHSQGIIFVLISCWRAILQPLNSWNKEVPIFFFEIKKKVWVEKPKPLFLFVFFGLPGPTSPFSNERQKSVKKNVFFHCVLLRQERQFSEDVGAIQWLARAGEWKYFVLIPFARISSCLPFPTHLSLLHTLPTFYLPFLNRRIRGPSGQNLSLSRLLLRLLLKILGGLSKHSPATHNKL